MRNNAIYCSTNKAQSQDENKRKKSEWNIDQNLQQVSMCLSFVHENPTFSTLTKLTHC